jgi:hypothetical protein
MIRQGLMHTVYFVSSALKETFGLLLLTQVITFRASYGASNQPYSPSSNGRNSMLLKGCHIPKLNSIRKSPIRFQLPSNTGRKILCIKRQGREM